MVKDPINKDEQITEMKENLLLKNVGNSSCTWKGKYCNTDLKKTAN